MVTVSKLGIGAIVSLLLLVQKSAAAKAVATASSATAGDGRCATPASGLMQLKLHGGVVAALEASASSSHLKIPMEEVRKYIAGPCLFLQPHDGEGCFAVASTGELIIRKNGSNCEEFEINAAVQKLQSRTTETCLTVIGDHIALASCDHAKQEWNGSSARTLCSDGTCIKKTSTKIKLISAAGICIRFADIITSGSDQCAHFAYEASSSEATFSLKLYSDEKNSQCLEITEGVVAPKVCSASSFFQKFVRVAERICTLDGFGSGPICFEIEGFQPPLAPASYASYVKQRRESHTVGVPWAEDVDPGILAGDDEKGTELLQSSLSARHASLHLRYSRSATWWYNEINVLHAPQDSYFMANGHVYGYFGIQWAGSHLPFAPVTTKVLCSIWDPPSCSSNDQHACLEASRARVVQCGTGVTCSDRFGGEGSGAKSYLNTPLQLGVSYGFMTKIVPSGNNIQHSCYFHSPAIGGWKLISTIEVAREGRAANINGMYSFLEDWTGRAYNSHRNGQYGPAFTSDDTGARLNSLSQDTQVQFSYTPAGTETEHTSHGYPAGAKVGMAMGGHGFPQSQNPIQFNLPAVGIPVPAQTWISTGGQLVTGGGGYGGENGGGASCFARGSSHVYKSTSPMGPWKVTRMDELRAGDYVLSMKPDSGSIFVESVLYNFHLHDQSLAPMLKIQYDLGYITVTADHLLFVNGEALAARFVKPGDTMQIAHVDDDRFSTIVVKDIVLTSDRIVNPMTSSGTILVVGNGNELVGLFATTVVESPGNIFMAAPQRSILVKFVAFLFPKSVQACAFMEYVPYLLGLLEALLPFDNDASVLILADLSIGVVIIAWISPAALLTSCLVVLTITRRGRKT